MPNDERGHNFRNQQEELRTGDRGGTSSSDSMSARTLTVALGVVLGLLVVLVVLLVR